MVSDLVNLLAIVCLPPLLNEDVGAIIRRVKDDSLAPYIVSSNPLGENFEIMSDGVSMSDQWIIESQSPFPGNILCV